MPSKMLKSTGERTWQGGSVWEMDISKDRFVHFTTFDRAQQIIAAGKLMMRPPYDKFGGDAVYAVSAVWGDSVIGTQTTHIKGKNVVAIVFQTSTKPKYGFVEEVVWDRDVVLRNPKVVTKSKGLSLIKGANSVTGDDMVRYANESSEGTAITASERVALRTHLRKIDAAKIGSSWKAEKKLEDALSKAIPEYVTGNAYNSFDSLADDISNKLYDSFSKFIRDFINQAERTKKHRYQMGKKVKTTIVHPVKRDYQYDYNTCYYYEELHHPESVTWTVSGKLDVAKAVKGVLQGIARSEKVDLRKLEKVYKAVGRDLAVALWEEIIEDVEPTSERIDFALRDDDMQGGAVSAWADKIDTFYYTGDDDPACEDLGEVSYLDERKEKWQFWRGDAKATALGGIEIPYKAEVEIEGTGNSHAVRRASRVAAKYKNKKQVDKADGSGTTTVYEYSEGQVQHRNTQKAKKVEALRKSIGNLRTQYTKDLTDDDPKTRLTALGVALIDQTCERPGNEESVKERGHFGISTLQARHVSFKGSKAVLSYTGKSGVKHTKEVTESKVVAALKKACEGKSGEDTILCDGEDCTVAASDLNTYLKPFDVTAKDIRGMRANEEMKTRLEEERKKGPELPRDRKEKDEILKKEFEAALKATAKVVGHEEATLKGQYLVPKLESSYMHDGTVIDKLYEKSANKQDHLNAVVQEIRIIDSLILRSDFSEMGDRKELWKSFELLKRHGKLWLAHVIDTKAIPPRKAKGVEMLARAFSKNFRGRGFNTPQTIKWLKANRKRFPLLLATRDFPERTAEGGGIWTVGPFEVHDTVGADEKERQRVTEIIERAIRVKGNTGLPGFPRVLYGKVYIVGQVARRNWAAWYMPAKDAIYMRVKGKSISSLDAATTLVHELTHRYKAKVMSRDTWSQWNQYHYDVGQRRVEPDMPNVGDVLPFKVNRKEVIYLGRSSWSGEERLALKNKPDEDYLTVPVFKFRGWFENIAKEAKYPSAYAATDAEEHLCEAAAFRAMGKLDNKSKEFMDQIMAGDYQAHAAIRVAARWLQAAGKYDHINFKPPQGVANAAAKGLEYRQKASPSNKGGLTPSQAAEEGIGSGVQRAVNLKNRNNLTPETIKKMVGFFSRHEKNKGVKPENKGEPWNDKGHVAWLLWGGDPGKAFADKVKKQMDAADAKQASRVAQRYLSAGENEPTNPKLWEKVISLAKGELKSLSVNGKTVNGPNDGTGFQKYPTAYANGWASNVYGDLGGGWKKKEKKEKKARGKAKKDVGQGGLDEWFSGHGGAKGKGENATWGDWVSISPVTKTLPSGKKVEKGDIVGDCGISSDPDWKEETKGGKNPLKCMPRQKAYDMDKSERAEKAKAKQKAEKSTPNTKKPTKTETFEKKAGSGFYKPMSEMTDIQRENFEAPVPAWLDRDYPFVAPPNTHCTMEELRYLKSLVPLREKYKNLIVRADIDFLDLYEELCETLGCHFVRAECEKVMKDGSSLIQKLKWKYNRIRPYQFAEKHGIDFQAMETKTGHSPAYPSGHTLQSLLVASCLSEHSPQHRQLFMRLAEMISWSRALGGYHWPSDLMYSEDLFRHVKNEKMPSSIRVALRQRLLEES